MTFADAALTVTITWYTFKLAGIALFSLSLVALFCGDLPDHAGVPIANAARWVAWPLLVLWLVALLVRTLVL